MRLYLIGKPRLEWTEFARFARDEKLPEAQQYMVEPPSDGETIAEIAGRICYMSFDNKAKRTNAQYLSNIIGHQHYSVLEHANFTFIFTGVSRALTHELVRHRHFSFSQLSQRYVDHSKVEAVVPAAIQGELEMELLAHHIKATELYQRIVEAYPAEDLAGKKRIRGAARAVLPECTETKIVVTGNVRTWREFIEKRLSPAADAEIRGLASKVLDVLYKEAPSMFTDLLEFQ